MHDLMSNDHEWSSKIPTNEETVTTEFPRHGSRVIFRLYWDVSPLACENFATLCTNGGNSLLHSTTPGGSNNNNKKPKPAPIGESGKELTYRNSTIHRVVKGFIVQGGDFVFGNGSGGESIYNGKKFKDERAGLGLKHDRAGILSMGNSGKNSNTSQFFVTLHESASQKCDGKHVVFGEVVSGMEVISAVEAFATPGGGGEPSVPITITDCGAYSPLSTPGAGFWYDRPDSESYTGITPEFVIRPRVGILAPNEQACERFRKALGEHASVPMLVAAEDAEGGGEDGEIAVVRSVLEQLETFALDVVVVAPACAKLLALMDVPSSWMDVAKKSNGASWRLPEKEEVFIEAKPVEVLSAILSKSWVGRRQGWLLSSSFRAL
mmetsp:Transcript_40316/g.84349  ORF Transcript_40316/g.84349 Transcript_40316/m.84349 type:complete len:379 (+) Transcript_40316:189-1325(+)